EGRVEDAIPPGANARNAVYEYGGGSYAVGGGAVYYTEFGDGRVWVVPGGGEARPISRAGPWRFADLTLDPARPRLYAVEEDRSGAGEPAHRIVSLDLETDAAPLVLVEGADFYSSPTPSPDGSKLAWISWSHPDMPWDATELWVAEVDQEGRVRRRERVAGGEGRESIREPRFAPGGELWFASDRSGFWNLYRTDPVAVTGAIPAADAANEPRPAPSSVAEGAFRITPVTALEAEVGGPQWVFGESFYAFVAPDDVVLAASHRGEWRLHRVRSGAIEDLPARFTDLRYLGWDGRRVVFIGASPLETPSVVALDLGGGDRVEVLRRSSDPEIDPAYVSRPRTVELETTGGARAYGFFYPPAHAELEGPEEERPPLVVLCHGGPTSAVTTALSPVVQFWTSRGFAVVDLNYRGSTGFGRAYRESLNGAWGTAEVDDCVAAVRHLAAAGEIDPERALIRGGSAGGYTTLAALAFRDVFRAGASYYGVADLEALARDTHKFESRYLDRLIGPYPARRDLYRARSPLHAAERLSCPVIFFQGLEDKVVPPNQAELMVGALRRRGLPVAYVPFAGEQHGFRRAENIRRALECELYFYSRVFGFELLDAAPELVIENL
ncbi:MAG TPA: S9 family peptidase, partial [Thermoanaerobaculia bacterium]|nr:S9 family peptidase [Thermoanaerobaculia bacterium]